MLDLDDIAEVVAGAVREATTPLLARIDALEKRELPVPEKGEPGEPGEPGPKGDPGPAGEVDMDAVRNMLGELTRQTVTEQLADAVKAIPAPEPVEPLAPDMDAIGKMIEDGIARAVAALPPPAKGEPGVGVAGAVIDREGSLVLTLSDGETCNLGCVVGKDGEPGATFTLDDFDVEPLDERTIRLGFTQGAEKHTFELKFPVLIGRGLWRADDEHERGDVCIWGGSSWEAVEPIKSVKPDAPNSGWRLFTKRGRDGKDAPK